MLRLFESPPLIMIGDPSLYNDGRFAVTTRDGILLVSL
jgi:hypothetical protein